MTNDRTARRWWARLLAGTACAAAVALAVPAVATAAPAPPAADAAAAKAQAAAAKAQAAAAKAAAQSAAAATKSRTTWQSHDRPTAMVIIRPTGIDLVSQGRLTRRIPRSGAVTLGTLSRYLPSSWLAINGPTARLSAAIVLTPGTSLTVGAPITKLQLAGGAAASDAASLYTGSGALTLSGVTVTSADRTSGQVLQAGPGRPYILVSPGGRLTATDSTLDSLGSAPPQSESDDETAVEDHPAVDFHTGSTGSLVRTSILHGGTGLQLDESVNVHLENITVSGSVGDGILLHGDRGTTMSGINAQQNGGYGVHVNGPSTPRPLTGITASGNGAYGIGIDKQTGLQVTGVTTSDDATGGLEITQSQKMTITGFTAKDEPIGVFTHVNNTAVVLDKTTITGGRRGMEVEKTTQGLTLQNSTLAGASVAAISAGGKNLVLKDVAVNNAAAALRVERGASGVTATDLKITGGEDGVVASAGTTGLLLQDLRADGLTGNAVRSDSPDARIIGGAIAGGSTGITLGAATTLSGTSINLTDAGIRVASTGLVHADDVDVNAVSIGIDTEGTSPVLVTRSRIHALESIRGTVNAQGANDLSLPPLNLLGAIGVPLIVLAVALQAVAAFRGRRFGGDKRRKPPVAAALAGAGAPTTAPTPVQPAPVG